MSFLDRLYKSLCEQTCFDFEWLIVDDGSTDKTKDFLLRLNLQLFLCVIIFKKMQVSIKLLIMG